MFILRKERKLFGEEGYESLLLLYLSPSFSLSVMSSMNISLSRGKIVLHTLEIFR
jgi:hypothetical protein